jgi:hypothetical protein
MKPQTIGRVLGIGVRVAGRMAGQRLAAPQVSETRPGVPARSAVVEGAAKPTASGAAVRRAGVAAGAVGRGVGGFLRPFRRVGNIVFLEVVGVFFLLFAIGFGNWAWRLRAQAVHGPEHAKFLAYAAMTLVFLYLGVSSFWRARRR